MLKMNRRAACVGLVALALPKEPKDEEVVLEEAVLSSDDFVPGFVGELTFAEPTQPFYVLSPGTAL